MALNNVSLNGRITRDLELKYSGAGTAILNFSIAVERDFKDKNGERKTDFINVTAFGKTAETISNFFNKGDGIVVTGRIQTSTYKDNNDKTVYVTDIIVNNFSFAQGTKMKNSGQGNNQNNQPQQNDPFESNNNVVEIQDDDLPF